MSRVKRHTPGPWSVAEGGDDVVTAYEDTEGSILVIAERCGQDAEVISAAPELLEALEEALNAMIGCSVPAGGVDDRQAIISAQKSARAAISKARGEAA